MKDSSQPLLLRALLCALPLPLSAVPTPLLQAPSSFTFEEAILSMTIVSDIFFQLLSVILVLTFGFSIYFMRRQLKRLEQSRLIAEERAERLSRIAAHSPSMLFEFHLDEDEIPVIDYCSEGCKALFGLEVEDILGNAKPLSKLIKDEDRDTLRLQMLRALAKDESYKIEFRISHPETKDRWMLAKAVPGHQPGATYRRWNGYVIDITDRKQSEDLSSSQYAPLGNILDTLPDIVFYKDKNGRYLGCNKVMCRANGLSREQVIGKTDMEIFPPEIAAAYIQDDKELMEGWGAHRKEEWIILPDGTHCLFEFIKAPYFDADGAVAGVLGVGRDVTQQREQRMALVEAQRIANMGNWVLHADTGRVEWSENVFHIFGLDPQDEAPDRDEHYKMFLPGESERVEKAIQHTLLNNVPYELKFKIRRADGAIRTVYTRGKRITLEGGTEIPMLLGTIQDITEQEEAARRLSDLNERFTMATESARIGIWDYHISTGRLIWDNIMFELFDVEPSDFNGTLEDWKKTVVEEDVEVVLDLIDQAISGSRSLDTTFRIHRKNGDIHYLRAIGSLYRDEQGEPIRFVGTNWDVTAERRAQEEAIDARKAAEEADRAKSAFLATMSHEIRTPMNGVIGMTQILSQTNLSPEQAEYMNIIRVSGETLLALINDVLDYSKIEAGKLDLEHAPFDLRNCVHEAMEILAGSAHNKGLELVSYIAPEVPDQVIGDVTRLRQILMNLIGNAIKFTEKGDILIKAELKEREDNTASLHFSVRDTGIGIPKDKQGALFKVFSQIDSSNTRQYGGSGLGLAISKSLSEAMGGQMWVESDSDVGSTFHFTIFIHTRETKEHADKRMQNTLYKGYQVLLVEGNKTCRDIYANIFAEWGFRVIAVPTAEEALELLPNQKFDLVVSNLRLPDNDGITFAEAWDKLESAPEVPRILLTTVGETQRTTSYDAALKKPFRVEQLLETISKLVLQKNTKMLEHKDQDQDESHPLPTEKPVKILLAEDNKINQKVTMLLLKSLGYSNDVVENGQEVLEAMEQTAYDVILLDVQMPVMDGYEAAQELRAKEDAHPSNPYIIALTAGAMQGDRERALACGMNDYLSKPVKKEELSRALEQAKEAIRARNG